MAFQTIRKPAPKARTKNKRQPSRRSVDLAGRLCLSTDCRKVKRPNGTIARVYTMRVSIPAPIMEFAKIQPGTKVEFEVDPDSRRCRILPDNDGRWTITQNAGHLDKGYLKITLDEGMPTVASTEPCLHVRSTSQGLEFSVPDNASFDRNLRAEADSAPQSPLPGFEVLKQEGAR